MGKRPKKRKKTKNQNQFEYFNPDQDDYFYYIAGYTDGGFPYGITWDEAREQGLIEDDELDDLFLD